MVPENEKYHSPLYAIYYNTFLIKIGQKKCSKVKSKYLHNTYHFLVLNLLVCFFFNCLGLVLPIVIPKVWGKYPDQIKEAEETVDVAQLVKDSYREEM